MSVYVDVHPESPIEELLAVALCEHIREHYFDDDSDPCVDLRSQVDFGRYRVDFLLTSYFDEGFARSPVDVTSHLVIECDGHEWHERTKEQARRDRRRDRWFLRLGAPVIRFTGSEIVADPRRCAEDAFKALDALDRIQTSGAAA